MLSAVSEVSTAAFFVQGQTGDEAFLISYQGEVIADFTSPFDNIETNQLQEIQFAFEEETLNADDFRIEFINDQFREGFDRNLRVDRLEIDGRVFRTDDPSVFSTGTYLAEDGIVDGFGRGDTLHANGFFQFSADGAAELNQTTLISFDARALGTPLDQGETATVWELLIQGEKVDEGALFIDSSLPGDGTFVYRAQGDVRAEDVEIAFTNDTFFQTADGRQIDSNLQVTSVTIGQETFTPGESNVFSTGTYLAEDGIVDGFGRGNILHANGAFSFYSARETTEIVIGASAEGGLADFNLLIDDVVVADFTTRIVTPVTLNQEFTFIADGDIAPDRIKIEFTNDSFTVIDSDFGPPLIVDVNLVVDEIRIGPGLVINPAESIRIFSTGTYRPEDGFTAGFGRGDTLHTNGFFQIFADREI